MRNIRVVSARCTDLLYELEDYTEAFERFSDLHAIRADMLGPEHPRAPPPLPLSPPFGGPSIGPSPRHAYKVRCTSR